MTTKRRYGGESAVAEEVLALGAEALEKLESALRRAHDVADPGQRRDISLALFGVRERLRDVLPPLQAKLGRSSSPPGPVVRGSGG